MSSLCNIPLFSPLQLLLSLKKVQFSLENTSVSFDANGNPPTGYDIVTWIWRGSKWSLRVVGSFTPDPITLTIDADQIEWQGEGDSRAVRVTWLFFFFP